MKTIHRLQNAKGIFKKARVTAQGLLIVKKEIGVFWKKFFMNKNSELTVQCLITLVLKEVEGNFC